MRSIIDRYPRLVQFVKFCVAGATGAGIDFGLYALLTRFLGVFFLTANVMSVLCSMVANFLINKYWTFSKKGQGKIARQSARYLIFATSTYLLNQLLVYTLVTRFHFLDRLVGTADDFLAKVIAACVIMMINYFGNRYWIFKT